MLLDDPKVGALTAKQKVVVSAAREDSDRLYRIIENLLNISRIETGQANLQIRSAAPSELVNQGVESVKSQCEERGIHVQVDVPDGLPEVPVDPVFVGYALGNLLSNALKFTPAAGTVSVCAAQTANAVTISVTDTGRGIPPEYAPRIFQKFFRIPQAQGPSGVGLGLAIAKEIVEAHGGTIAFESPPAGGSTFRFSLPITARS